LDQVLGQDSEAANAFFRENVKVKCRPMERGGRRFYRASGEANGAEIIKSLGLAQAFDFGGCGGLDLNQRPLGYEGKSSPHSGPEEPSRGNGDEGFRAAVVGLFWLIGPLPS
jgi:hypothetical protein